MTTSMALNKWLKHPLTLAVSSCLLVACSTTPTAPPVATRAPVVLGTPPLQTVPLPQATSSVGVFPVQSPQPTPQQNPPVANQGVLDDETLAILQDLLEARDMTMVEGDQISVARYGNLWDRIKVGYRITQPAYNERIETQKRWFSSNQNYLNRLTARASRYLHYTITEAERRGIPTELALLPIIESSYDPAATSNAQAAGLWQFIPSTGRVYGLAQTPTFDGRRDIIESTRAAYDFLTSLYNQFGSWELALAAYNAGPGRVQRAIDANIRAGLPADYWSLRLPTETMNYVPRFMAVAQIVNAPEHNGVYLPKIANHVHFRAVPVNQGVSLSEVSAITGVSFDELQLLNPALLSGRVEAVAPSRIIIPNSLSAEADRQLASLQGDGYATRVAGNTQSYIAPNSYTTPVVDSERVLALTNTLPATSAMLTPQRTVVQEPPLTAEEIRFIAEELKKENPNVQPIAADGKINLQALQTGQSVLEARGQTKSLRYNSPRPQQRPLPNNAPKAQSQSHTVKAAETLTGIARLYGLTLSQLAGYNNLDTNARLVRGQKLWLVPNKVNPRPVTQPTAKTTTYKVQRGDTLIGLSARLGVTPNDIAVLNAFDANAPLIAGRTINVPATNSTTKPTRATSSTYTVKAGDSLTSVAAKHDVSIAELASANNLSTNAGLIRGKTLTIPKAGSGNVSATSHTSAGNVAGSEGYQVKAGDTLISLAGRFGVSIAELAKANNLATNARLTIGQTLNVPKFTTTYKVKAGDTLIGLARQFGISTDELAKMNGLKPTDGLRRGQNLTVPNR